MLTNSKESTVNLTADFPKYIGVASIKVLAVNPNNEKLRSIGWNVPADADEPQYVKQLTTPEGTVTLSRVRFVVRIEDMKGQPVIALDFPVGKDFRLNKDKSKVQIIDAFGRSAWATKAESMGHSIPVYGNGEKVKIDKDYKLAHRGEEPLINFLRCHLNVTPFETYNKKTQKWEPSPKPGKLTIDHWDKLVSGDASEIEGYINERPENRSKVILGVRINKDNRSFQTFLNTKFLSNGCFPDKSSGVYTQAATAIGKYADSVYGKDILEVNKFSATVVSKWSETPTEVSHTEIHDEDEDTPDNEVFDGNEFEDDLPFD